MKKLTTIILFCLLTLALTFSLVACGDKCDHTYDNACDATCNECGETREVGAHDFADADCDTPKTCKVCGATEGSALGHEWTTPDVDLCEVQSTCSRCGATDGENKEHAPAEDDGDCSTEVKCTVCGDVTTPAGQHTPNDDDGNCLTAITCQNCSEVLTAARSEHEANADDGDCTTAVTCKHCTTVLTEAKSAHEASEDDGDCTTDIICKHCEQVAVAGNASHTPNADDGNCLTAITCSVCGTTTTPAKDSHTGGTATCTEKAVCAVCSTAYGAIDVNNHIDENTDHTCDRECGKTDIGTHADSAEDNDHVCDYGCKVILEDHKGGTATCVAQAVCTICGNGYGELAPNNHTSTEFTYTENNDGTHNMLYACCEAVHTENEAHTFDLTTGKCGICDTAMTVIATVTDDTNTYYAVDADTLNQAVTAILETGSGTFTVELPADAEAGMITAIRRAICDTEGVADGSIHLTLKGVTTIPGTTNWDGVAFGPRDAQWDENNVEIVSHEEVTQLASINLPDVTEIGAQAFLDCSNLTSITAPKVQSIGDWGLQSTAITSIDMPLLKEAGYSAFWSTALTEVSLPSLETAGVIVFGHCKQLRTVDLPKLQNLSQQLFTRCTSLVAVNAPAATSMGINVFKGCSELVSITLPGVTELTYEAFAECTKLENITLGSVITSVNVNLFGSDSSLSSNITLTLNCGQKNAETLPAAAGTNVEWAGFTWKEVKFAHSYVNSKCTACGEDCTHTGGEATCTEKAICEACGVSYGAVDTTNHDSSVECENDFCPNGCYEPAILNAEGYYEIDNAGKLFWFAQQVNVKGNREIKGVLTAHIDLENRPWTPIGSTDEENSFRGVFDGQNHTIKGLYVEGTKNGVGFFGEVRTGTVKNFTIYGEVVVNTEVDYVGGVIGSICGVNGETDLERNGAIIQNITSYVNLTAKAHGVGMIGGFVGYANHQSLIEKCAWYGTFDAGIYRVDSGAGGFIGKIQENTSEVTIRNCGAYGTIKTDYVKNSYNNYATIYMGGFLSFSNTNAKTTLENCLFAGRFERGENLTDQAFLGAFGTLRSVNAIKNCYYLGDDGLEAVHSDSDLKPGSDNVEITKVTEDDLRNSTIVTQLGNYWEQDVHYPIPKDTKAHSDSATYTYTDNGDGTHKATCTVCGYEETSRPHTIENHVCTACGAMEIVVSFDAGDFEWKTGDKLYFCRVSRDNQWEEYCFTATVAEDGTVTWTPDKPLYWDGTGEHRLFVSYPCTAVGWDDFMIPTDQSDVDKLKKADCMNARWIGTPTTNVIEFELKHRMAKITVNYSIASQFDLDAPVIAEIYSNAMYCIFSDADGLPIITSVGQYDAWITPYYNDNQFTVYVAPGEYNTDGMFKFYIGDTEVQIEIVNPGAVTLEEGGEYTFDVKVGQDVIYIEEVSMGDIDSPFGVGWTSDTEEDLGAVSITDTQDEGKTAWENGDQIIVTFTSPSFGTQYGTLTYNASDNTWSTDVSFSYLENETPTVSAIYAPCYEVVDGNMQLKDGMQLGMTEYISAACSITDGTINISFEGVTRNYSRLRISTLPGQTLTVTTTGFTPAGATAVANDVYTLSADENGNIYLYGTFAVGATVSVKQGEVTLAHYTFSADKHPEGTKSGINYALDAMPVIDGTLGGKTTATEEDLTAMVELLRSYIENGMTTIIVTGNQPAKLLKSGYLTPVVSLAFEQLTSVYQDENIDIYWGTVDLIYQDVTEIVEYEFYCCDVLKSITLPNVTTVGDRGFWACYYLETLTFGSVVTNITDNSGEVFYDLGYKIDGCNLVLNAEQVNVATEYQPNIESKTWWNTEWQSITLK